MDVVNIFMEQRHNVIFSQLPLDFNRNVLFWRKTKLSPLFSSVDNKIILTDKITCFESKRHLPCQLFIVRRKLVHKIYRGINSTLVNDFNKLSPFEFSTEIFLRIIVFSQF